MGGIFKYIVLLKKIYDKVHEDEEENSSSGSGEIQPIIPDEPAPIIPEEPEVPDEPPEEIPVTPEVPDEPAPIIPEEPEVPDEPEVPIIEVIDAIPIGKNKPQKWYGRVNYWTRWSQTTKDISACAKYKLHGYMIEMAGWANSTGTMWTQSWLNNIETNYSNLVDLVRKNGLWLFVSIVNDNLGSGKYGDDGKHTIKKEMKYAEALGNIVKKYGNKNVIVQPVAETHTGGGKNFDNWCKKNMTEFQLVYNGGSGRPGGKNGMQYRAWHPPSISDTSKTPSDAFCVSDHGQLIKELGNGSLDGKMNTKKIGQWYNAVKKRKCPVIGYYAFKLKDHDANGIRAMGNLK